MLGDALSVVNSGLREATVGAGLAREGLLNPSIQR
jgi:hypothetical protein